MRLIAALALTFAMFAAGCQSGQTAPTVYKLANQSRYNTVSTWLADYATLKPELAPRISDVVTSWDKEVQAQRAASTPPTQ